MGRSGRNQGDRVTLRHSLIEREIAESAFKCRKVCRQSLVVSDAVGEG